MRQGRGATQLAKISRPEVPSVIRRPRLFLHMDEAADKPLIWITSPGGSGKTTLISSYIEERKLPYLWYRCDEGDGDPAAFFHYMALASRQASTCRSKPLPSLTPEYLPSLPTFTRRYFQDLYGRLKKPSLLVLDNHQTVPSDSHFNEILAQGLEVIPAGMTMVILSRHEPPGLFARLIAYERMAVLGWDDLRFSLEETAEVAGAALRGEMTREAELDLYRKTDGWIAAIVLVLERARQRGVNAALPGEIVSEDIFEYFVGEILRETAPPVRDFLLQTAFLPTVSAPLAQRLTGEDDAGRMLATLAHQNYFTKRLSGGGQEYEYHPLFQASLKACARSQFTPAALSALVGRAATILRESGRQEEAAALFAEGGDWEGLGKLLAETARTFVQEGRTMTLENYLRALPAPTLGATPQLLYWLGICRMPFDVDESRELLERAFQIFNDGGDAEWALASWVAVVDSIITEHNDITKLDPWIDWLEERDGLLESLPLDVRREAAAYMFFALTFRRPSHPKLALWVERAEALLWSGKDLPGTLFVGGRLVLHYTLLGEVRKAGQMLKEISPPPGGATGMRALSLLQWHVFNAIYATLGSASAKTCLEAVEQGLALSREHGVRLFDPLLLYFGAVSYLTSGDETAADRLIEEMTRHKAGFNEMQAAYYISLLAWKDLILGDARSAAGRIGAILPITERLGHTINSVANHIGLAQALFDMGERERASRQLASARELQGTNSLWLDYMIAITEADWAFQEGREADSLEQTRRAMAISRRSGMAVFIYWRPSVLGRICAKALEADIETAHVRELIRKLHLMPEGPSFESESWPWPVRIYTLGRFRVVLNDSPLEFSGKVPQRPLELLKALISFGGRDVPEERLAEALWPEADGDLAHQSFEVTLRRLRQLLGGATALHYGARNLSLDRRFCWVDSLAVENLLAGRGAARGDQSPNRLDEALRLYQGPFLPSDTDRDWAVSRREGLQGRLGRAVEDAARREERMGQWEGGAAFYRKGLELDPLAENLYRGLMACYIQLGRRPEAMRTYLTCCKALQAHLGIAPSKETQALYSSLLRK